MEATIRTMRIRTRTRTVAIRRTIISRRQHHTLYPDRKRITRIRATIIPRCFHPQPEDSIPLTPTNLNLSIRRRTDKRRISWRPVVDTMAPISTRINPAYLMPEVVEEVHIVTGRIC